MKKITIIILTLLIAKSVFPQYKVETVPDPKKNNGGYVSNPDKVLSQTTVDSLNNMIYSIDTANYAQIAVVVLNSIGDEVPKNFATELFNYWHIGNKELNNGLLILLVMDQHRVEFETGYGLEDKLTDADCYKIQQEYMVPQFKAGNYDIGIINGVIRIYSKLISDSLLNENQIQQNDYYYNDINDDYTNTKKRFFDRSLFKLYFNFVLKISVLYFIALLIGLFNKDKYKSYKLLRPFTNIFMLIFAAIPFLPLLILNKWLLKRWRNMPRISPQGYKMRLLNEEEDDKYLEGGQIKEEIIKSIDYDVWIADESGETLILGYVYRFTPYRKCPKCKYKTYYQKSNVVIQAATYSSSGKGQRTYVCENCGHKVVSTYIIPKNKVQAPVHTNRMVRVAVAIPAVAIPAVAIPAVVPGEEEALVEEEQVVLGSI